MYWIREIAGWLLIVVALLLIRTAATFVTDIDSPRIVEAGVIVFAAVSVLKAGTLLIRISTAARLCRSNPPSDKIGV